MELRKYVDIGGAPGIDHLILTDRKGVQRIDCCECAVALWPRACARHSDARGDRDAAGTLL